MKDFYSKTKIANDSWYFNNSHLSKSDFSLATKGLLSSLKKQKNNYSSKSDLWKYTKSHLKKSAGEFFRNSTTKENIRNSRLKKRLRNLYKKKISRQKFNRWLKIFQMNYINLHAKIILELECKKLSKT